MIIKIETFSEVTTDGERKKVFVESYDIVNDQFTVNWKWSEPYKDIINNDTDVYEQLMKTFKVETNIQMRIEL